MKTRRHLYIIILVCMCCSCHHQNSHLLQNLSDVLDSVNFTTADYVNYSMNWREGSWSVCSPKKVIYVYYTPRQEEHCYGATILYAEKDGVIAFVEEDTISIEQREYCHKDYITNMIKQLVEFKHAADIDDITGVCGRFDGYDKQDFDLRLWFFINGQHFELTHYQDSLSIINSPILQPDSVINGHWYLRQVAPPNGR